MDSVLNLLSFSMRGFKNGCNVVQDLLNSNIIIALQEHWLRPDKLSTLGLISEGVSYYGASGMSRDMSSGILQGRPYGGCLLYTSPSPRD